MTPDVPGRLRQARRAKGWSQRQLSEHAGIPQAHISRIESGAVDPKVSTLQDLARVLDLELLLAPRTALTAVDALLREDAEEVGRRRVQEIIAGLWKAATTLQAMAGGLNDRVADAATALSRLDLSDLSASMRQEVLAAAGVVDEAVRGQSPQRLEPAIASLNRVVADAKTQVERGAARPAYSLDDED